MINVPSSKATSAGARNLPQTMHKPVFCEPCHYKMAIDDQEIESEYEPNVIDIYKRYQLPYPEDDEDLYGWPQQEINHHEHDNDDGPNDQYGVSDYQSIQHQNSNTD